MSTVTCYCYVGPIYFTRGQGADGGHRGQDFSSRGNKEILCPPLANGGVVTVSERMPDGEASYGNWIEIKHKNGFYSRYAHMESRRVSVGQIVKTAQILGIEGSTGDSTGSHLHAEYLTPDKQVLNPQPLTGLRNNLEPGYYENDYDPEIPIITSIKKPFMLYISRRKDVFYGKRF